MTVSGFSDRFHILPPACHPVEPAARESLCVKGIFIIKSVWVDFWFFRDSIQLSSAFISVHTASN